MDWKCELNLVIRPGNKTSEVHLVNPDQESRALSGAKELRSHGAKRLSSAFKRQILQSCACRILLDLSRRMGRRKCMITAGAEVMVIKTPKPHRAFPRTTTKIYGLQ